MCIRDRCWPPSCWATPATSPGSLTATTSPATAAPLRSRPPAATFAAIGCGLQPPDRRSPLPNTSVLTHRGAIGSLRPTGGCLTCLRQLANRSTSRQLAGETSGQTSPGGHPPRSSVVRGLSLRTQGRPCGRPPAAAVLGPADPHRQASGTLPQLVRLHQLAINRRLLPIRLRGQPILRCGLTILRCG